MLVSPWRIELFGGLRLQQGQHIITRFRTQKSAVLLAYLAYYPQQKHSREALIELLWPERAPEAGRNILRVELNALRHQLEPPGTPLRAVLASDRTSVHLNSDAFTTDVADLETTVHAATLAGSDTERTGLLARAVEFYRGDFLPNYYEEWVLAERERMRDAYLSALRSLIRCLIRVRDYDRALEYGHRAISADPLREASHRDLMRLYAATGRPLEALHQYQELQRLLQEELGMMPSAATQELVAKLSTEGGSVPKGASLASTFGTSRTHAVVSTAPTPAPQSVSDAGSPISTRTGNLPVQFTRFFGREEEIARLQEMLRNPDIRLVTLTGSGGAGKTRLAVEVAKRMCEDFDEGVWFVPLADLSDPRLIPDAIREAMGLPASPLSTPLDQVREVLSRRRSLLVLDNLEHLLVPASQSVEDASSIVRTLLEGISTLSCLLTSRQRLNLSGEREWTVAPLPLPMPCPQTPEALMAFACVQIFVDRAQAVKPDFQVTQGNKSAVAAVCSRLEGIPLALELAAARAKVLTPSQTLAQLEQRLDFLVSRQRNTETRHRTLRAVVGWSYHLLPVELQQFFVQLSIFRGGWTLEAAEAICQEPEALDSLESLTEASLVTAQTNTRHGQARFGMLETTREFAVEQLDSTMQNELARRHAHYFLALAEEAEPQLLGPKQTEWLDRLEGEHDNLRLALDGMREQGETTEGLRLVGALYRFWNIRGHLHEGREWLARALAIAQERTPARVRALVGAASLACSQEDFAAARPLLNECLELSRQLDDRYGVAWSVRLNAYMALEQGDFPAARSRFEESLALFRDLEDRYGIASSLHSLGSTALKQGDLVRARPLFAESLELRKAIGDLRGQAVTLLNLGNVCFQQGDHATARSLIEHALTLFRQLCDSWGVAMALQHLGSICYRLGDPVTARSYFQQALQTHRRLGMRAYEAMNLFRQANVSLYEGDYASARQEYAESLTLLVALGETAHSVEILEGFARLAERSKETARAARLFGAAEALRESLGASLLPIQRAERDACVARLRAASEKAAFTTAWAEGRAMTLEQAVAYALQGSEEEMKGL